MDAWEEIVVAISRVSGLGALHPPCPLVGEGLCTFCQSDYYNAGWQHRESAGSAWLYRSVQHQDLKQETNFYMYNRSPSISRVSIPVFAARHFYKSAIDK